MNTAIVSHLAAASLPFIAIFVARRIRANIIQKKMESAFWSRQNLESLNAINILDAEVMPARFSCIEDSTALNYARRTISLCREYGIFDLLEQHPGITPNDVAEKVAFSAKHISSSFELLQGLGVVEKYRQGFALSLQGRCYLLQHSPLFEWALPRSKINTRVLKILQGGIIGNSLKKWKSGQSKASSCESNRC